MFKLIRIAILLLILATVAEEAWIARSRSVSWQDPLQVAIYPINGDDSDVAEQYVRKLPADAFKSIERFFDDEAKRHGRSIYHPVEVTLAPPLQSRPPQPTVRGNALQNILWSLQTRYWAWRHDALPGAKPQIRLFVLFFDPANNDRLQHSVGIRQGMIGLVNAFATRTMAGANNVVITHELLHTLGATDKYDLSNNQPLFPDGYAEPERVPRLPQELAEIMAGRVPIDESQAEIPVSLGQTVIGNLTAAEIGWTKR
jgi:hypothetical protein